MRRATPKGQSIDELAILKAALDQLRVSGPLRLRMTSLSDRCACSIGTIYRHFSSKHDLLAALLIVQMQRRNDLCGELANCRASTRSRMLAVLSADFILGTANPGLSRTEWLPAFGPPLPSISPQRREMLRRLEQDLVAIIHRIVSEALREGDLPGNLKNPADLCQAFLVMMRGGQLIADVPAFIGRCNMKRPQDAMILHFNHILNGLGWQPIYQPGSCAGPRSEIERLFRRNLLNLNGLLAVKIRSN